MLKINDSPWKTLAAIKKVYPEVDITQVRKFQFETLYYVPDAYYLTKTKRQCTILEEYIPRKEVSELLDISMDTLRERLKRGWYINVRYFETKENVYYNKSDFQLYCGQRHQMLEKEYEEWLLTKSLRINNDTIMHTIPKMVELKVKSKALTYDEWKKIGEVNGYFK